MALRPKNKAKKLEISTNTMMETINSIKSKWPEYPVSLEHLRTPRREFVHRFYQNCVNCFWQILSSVAHEDVTPQYPPHLESDMKLYNQLKEIPTINEIGFKLGDLYVFDPYRTNQFIQLAVHFIIFADNFSENTLSPITTDIHRLWEEFESKTQLYADLQENLNIIYQETGSLKGKNEKLVKILETTELEYDKIIVIKKEEDRLYEEKEKELKQLLEELENTEKHNQVLEEKISDLNDEVLTEEEFLTLKNVIDTEQKEEKDIEKEEEEIINWLKEHKSAKDHVEKCLMELKYFSQIKSDTEKLLNYRGDLKDAQQNYEHDINIAKGLDENKLQESLDNLSLQIAKMEKDKEILYDHHLQTQEEFTLMQKKSSEAYQQNSNLLRANIDKLHRIINDLEIENGTLEVGLGEKLSHIRQVLDRVIKQTIKRLATHSNG